MSFIISKVISGGQTGADQGGLEGAKAVGIPTGGFMPYGYRTEVGPRPDMQQLFGVVQSSSPLYPPRTKLNVDSADGTIIFGNIAEPGSRLTMKLCHDAKKPFGVVTPTELEDDVARYYGEHLRKWCQDNKISILNVAGNRESKRPGLQQFVSKVIQYAFKGT